jgi:hypothetical protein
MLADGARGMSLVFDLSFDRLLAPLALVLALAGTAMLCATLYEQAQPDPGFSSRP